jgi:hypothetical protein
LLRLELFDFRTEIFLGLAKFLLQTTEKFVVLTLGKRQVVVSQLTVLLFQFALHFVPIPFQFECSHNNKHIAPRGRSGRVEFCAEGPLLSVLLPVLVIAQPQFTGRRGAGRTNSKPEARCNAGEKAAGLSNPKQIRITKGEMTPTVSNFLPPRTFVIVSDFEIRASDFLFVRQDGWILVALRRAR